MKKYDAIIFDMDGTLLDASSLQIKILLENFRAFGVKVELKELRQLIGASWEDVMNFARGKIEQRKLKRFIRQGVLRYAFSLCRNGLATKDGAQELIFYCIRNGYKTALATNANKFFTRMNFKHSDLSIFSFTVVTTKDKSLKPKPNKDIYELTCKKLGIEPHKCLVIEDSSAGVQAGLDAGCDVVWVPDIERKLPQSLLNRIVLKADNLSQVATWLKKQNINENLKAK